MSVYVITGELGTGKSLLCVTKIAEALRAGRRVATNLDIRLEHLVSAKRPRDLLRLPDYPRREDLDALGVGCEEYDERRFGLLVIDEAGTFLNARDFRDTGRGDVIKWLLHSRKLRWDVFLIIQDLGMLDKQVRTAFVEHLVKCKRADRLTVPFLSPFLSALGVGTVTLPKFHFAIVRYGTSAHSIIVDRWVYTSAFGKNYRAYDTGQKLIAREIHLDPTKVKCDKDGVPVERVLENSLHSVLCPKRAPWLCEPTGVREGLYEALSDLAERPGLVGRLASILRPPMSPQRSLHLQFKMAERGDYPGPYKPAAQTFEEWASERAGRPGALGGAESAGEAPEPACHRFPCDECDH